MKALLLAAGVLFVFCAASFHLLITDDYPIDEACESIRKLQSADGKSPSAAVALAAIPRVKYLSILEYRQNENDFLLYFCDTRLGPCWVCNAADGPYIDEI
jgi:hypothetical protein